MLIFFCAKLLHKKLKYATIIYEVILMLLNFTIQNFEVFNEPVELCCEANMHTKKFLSNVIQHKYGNVLKSLAIYGPNNTGKTCIIEAIVAFRDVLLNKPFRFDSNVFVESPVVKLGAEFLWDDCRYSYTFMFNTQTMEFQYEKFAKIEIDIHGNKKEALYFERNVETKKSHSADQKLNDIMHLSSRDSILIYSFDTNDFPLLDEAKKVLRDFADNIMVLSMDRLSPLKTIEVLKKPESVEAKKTVGLIKAADLDIDDFMYSESIELNVRIDDNSDERLVNAIKNSGKLMDQLRLISVHKGKPLPSIKFDSNGTKKIVSLASYLVEALDKGKILVIDELDSGLQFKLSRAIISLFNNLINNSAQLICTTHDVSLLDIKTLFRKDQIWFTDKDSNQAYLYSLADFTNEKYGVRSDTDIFERYSKGVFGALPDPSLVEILLHSGKGEDE